MVELIAEKKGIPKERAQAILNALKEEEDFNEVKKFLTQLVDTAEVMKNLPQNIQPLAVPLVAQLWQTSKSRAEKIAENVAIISAALKAIGGTDDDKVEKLIGELRKEIEELKESKRKEELEEILDGFNQTVESITKYIERLEERLNALETNTSKPKEEKDDIDKIVEAINKLEETKEKLKKLGLLKEEELTLSKAEEILKKAGYKIEKPLSWDAVQKYVEEQIQKIREEAKKEAMEELKIEEKRLSMLTMLITTVVGSIFESLTPQSSEISSKIQEIKRRFEEWRQQQSQVQMQQE